jgi:hypothetical protein
VYPGDGRGFFHEAVAVRGGAILAIGRSADIERLRNERTQVIDARRRRRSARLRRPACSHHQRRPGERGRRSRRCSHARGDSESHPQLCRALLRSLVGERSWLGVRTISWRVADLGDPRRARLRSSGGDALL